nr:DDB1- and CUL4-associated factor 5 [Polyrhizophydium stewartii]
MVHSGHISNIFCLQFDSSGQHLLSSGNDGFLIRYDVERVASFSDLIASRPPSQGSLPPSRLGDPSAPMSARSRSRVHSSGPDGQLGFSGRDLISAHESACLRFSIDPTNDNVVLSSGQDGRIRLWDLRKGRDTPAAQFTARRRIAQNSVDFNPAAPTLFITADEGGGVHLYDMRMAFAGSPMRDTSVMRFTTMLARSVRSCRSSDITSAVWRQDGSCFVASVQRWFPTLYTPADPHPIYVFDTGAHADQSFRSYATVKTACFSSDTLGGEFVVAGSDDFSAYGWSVPPIAELREARSYYDRRSPCDPEKIVFGFKNTRIAPAMASGADFCLRGHRSLVNTVAAHPTLPMLVTAGVEKCFRVFTPSHADDPAQADTAAQTHEPEEPMPTPSLSSFLLGVHSSPESTEEDRSVLAYFDFLISTQAAMDDESIWRDDDRASSDEGDSNSSTSGTTTSSDADSEQSGDESISANDSTADQSNGNGGDEPDSALMREYERVAFQDSDYEWWIDNEDDGADGDDNGGGGGGGRDPLYDHYGDAPPNDCHSIHSLTASSDDAGEELRGVDMVSLRLFSSSLVRGRKADTAELKSSRGHDLPITALALHGQRLATGSEDQKVRLVDADSLEVGSVVFRSTLGVCHLEFSPDGAWLAVAAQDGDVHLVNVADTTRTIVLEGHTSIVKSVAFSPLDARIVVTSGADGTVRVWKLAFASAPLETGEADASDADKDSFECVKILRDTIDRIPTDSGLLSRIAWHPSGKYFAVCGKRKEIVFIKNGTWDILYRIRGHDDHSILTFSPNGMYILSAGGSGIVSIWRHESDRDQPIVSEKHSSVVTGVQWHPKANDLVMIDYSGQIVYIEKAVPYEHPHPVTGENRAGGLGASKGTLAGGSAISQSTAKELESLFADLGAKYDDGDDKHRRRTSCEPSAASKEAKLFLSC